MRISEPLDAPAAVSRRARPSVADLVAGLICVLGAVGFASFAAQHGLGTFADDSVSYVVMAQVLSPWRDASEAVASAFAREAFYPPLFPLLLGLVGAGHDLLVAHVVTALVLGASLVPAYLLAGRWLGHKGPAAAVAGALVLLPAFWIAARGILSEPLFCLVLLALFLALEERGAPRSMWLIAGLMCALVLTRTAGIGMLAGYVAWVLLAGRRAAGPLRLLAPVAAAGLAYAAWIALRPDQTADVNAGLAASWLHGVFSSPSPVGAVADSIARQAGALKDAWVGAILLFWVEGQPARPLIAGALGVLAIAGLVLRLLAGRPDPWMVLAYLGVHLAWPLYDQMTRFLFPVIPVLVLYAAVALAWALRATSRPCVNAAAILAFAIASLAGPGLAFMWQRAQWPGPQALIVDWYRVPDLDAAQRRADVHLGLAADMERLAALTRPGDSIMWVAPSYIALLAGRQGVQAPHHAQPGPYRDAVMAVRPDFVLLTQFHPRDTIRDQSYRTGVAALAGAGEVVYARRDAEGRAVSILLKLQGSDVR